MNHDSIIRPKNLLPQILNGHRLLEYYSEGMGPWRNSWRYLIFVETHQVDSSGGAGAIVNQRSGLTQTLSFNKAEVDALKVQLEALSLPIVPDCGLTLDGENGCIRIYGSGGSVDLNWDGRPPESWRPVFEWINSVSKMILDKAFDDAFDEPHKPSDANQSNLDE